MWHFTFSDCVLQYMKDGCVLQYIVERHADTLLPQYLGMYRITINDSETYIVVVRNIFSARLAIHRKYDLKVRRVFPVITAR